VDYWVNNYLQAASPGVRHSVLECRHHPDGNRLHHAFVDMGVG